MSVTEDAQRTFDDFLEAFRRLELEPFMAFFCEDASVFFPFSELPKKVSGHADIKRHFEEEFDRFRNGTGPANLEISPLDVQIIPLGTNALITFQLENDSRLGRRSLLLVERDAGLRILHLHASNINREPADSFS